MTQAVIQTKRLYSWAEFKTEIEVLTAQSVEQASARPSTLLFRGQSNADWKLSTTAERYFSQELSLYEYYRAALVAKPQVDTFSNYGWKIPRLTTYEKWLEETGDLIAVSRFRAYEYLAYLRHHGFPSPLLDWTRSPFVAAFFAYRTPLDPDQDVAIYAFCEMPEGMKVTGSDGPFIVELGQYVRAHKRHFMQQSQYTVCLSGVGKSMIYSNHEAVFERPQRHKQDQLWKFTLPGRERLAVLRDLIRMNIHPFSLFATEESLLETVFIKDVLLRKS